MKILINPTEVTPRMSGFPPYSNTWELLDGDDVVAMLEFQPITDGMAVRLKLKRIEVMAETKASSAGEMVDAIQTMLAEFNMVMK